LAVPARRERDPDSLGGEAGNRGGGKKKIIPSGSESGKEGPGRKKKKDGEEVLVRTGIKVKGHLQFAVKG